MTTKLRRPQPAPALSPAVSTGACFRAYEHERVAIDAERQRDQSAKADRAALLAAARARVVDRVEGFNAAQKQFSGRTDIALGAEPLAA